MILKTDKDEIQSYLTDASNFKGDCKAVYFPETIEELAEIIKESNERREKITFSGAGTGLVGGRVPEDGVSVSLEKMDKIIEINKEKKYAVVQAGVFLSHFKNEIEPMGLFYPPDPTEQDCFVGSTAATNASGAKSFKYGATREFILGLKVILADGETVEINRGGVFAEGKKLKIKTISGKAIQVELPEYEAPPIKNASGYFCRKNMDAIDLFIGSEGTLGAIAELKLKLLELPGNLLSCVVFFDEEEDALTFIEETRSLSRKNKAENNNTEINSRALEFFDSKTLGFSRDEFPNIPPGAKAAVWFEQEYDPENEEKILELWIEELAKYNADIETAWMAQNKNDLKLFQNFRHSPSKKVNEYISRANIRKIGTDLAVPDDKFKEFFCFVKEKAESSGIDYLIYGHFGDSHIHLNFLPKNDQEFNAAKRIYFNYCEKAVALNGVISAEHGIGKIKKEYFKIMLGENDILKMARLKKALDPNGILCPNNIFDEKYLKEI